MSLTIPNIFIRSRNLSRRLGIVRLYSNKNKHDETTNKVEIYGEEYPIWRENLTETTGDKSKFSLIGKESEYFNPETFKILHNPANTWIPKIREWIKKHDEIMENMYYEFKQKRFDILGANLAAAHFVYYRGGGIRFVGNDAWIRAEKGIPPKNLKPPFPKEFENGFFIEYIDCENMLSGGMRYEGLDNFENLNYIKYLSLKNNPKIDDWCLDKISNITSKSLEYLDLNGTSITHRGLHAFYRLERLKVLKLDEKLRSENLDNMCAMLEEANPELLIKIG